MQIIGVLAVLAGVAVASWPSGSSAAAAAAAAAAEIEPVYLVLCIASFAFPALATIIKERIFKVGLLQYVWRLLQNSECLLGCPPSLAWLRAFATVEIVGVAVASWPNGSSAAAAAEFEPVYLLLCIVSFAFPALATIIKERIFKLGVCYMMFGGCYIMSGTLLRCLEALNGALKLPLIVIISSRSASSR
jgi:hypothetical protein